MSLGGNVPGADNTVFICSLQVLRIKKEREALYCGVVFRFEAVITLRIIAGLNMFLEWFQTRSDDVSPGRLQPGISRG